MTTPPYDKPLGELLLYQTEDGRTRIECRFEGETLWLTQALMAELFQKDVRTVTDREVLDHAGSISAEVAKAKAEREYERYQAREDAKPRLIDAAFEATAKQLEKPAPTKPKRGKKP